MLQVHPKAPMQLWGRLKSEGDWLNNLLAWSRLRSPWAAVPTDTLRLWEEDEGCRDGIPRAGGPHSPPPAQRMLPSRLGFPSPPPRGLAPGRGKAVWGQPMTREGEAQTPLAGATPSQSSREAREDKHTSKCRNHQEKKSIKESPHIKSLPLRNARAGFCVCPNLALSLWKGLFVKCFVFMSPALISPR